MAIHTFDNTKRIQTLLEAGHALTKTVNQLATEVHDAICPMPPAAEPPPLVRRPEDRGD